MEHIIAECSSPGQKEVWKLIKMFLEHHSILWHPPTMFNILACVTPVFKLPGGNRDIGKECFYQIIISLSIQTIWNAQCEKNSSFLPEEIHNRWLKRINKRLDLDCLMTCKHFSRKALGKDLVLRI
ncbi:uncharacterized protein BT62DRAFT_1014726 [Guyanagaster necrorhizus]|uniref:Uncharacterized protein n=1 Tax=Guyanagaster necrorhizus TaxID=856835 RepID=A0A9P8AY37_9AGAR|nr:uncharacterized protein BT62DRAFT_1014726 [Guyanagaster necrorhizus MCA 3950]KAG7452479.1 hypothetical protein BT62DRAFT_1014726 [Guyanagaster necrorhizus MCA 3950]